MTEREQLGEIPPLRIGSPFAVGSAMPAEADHAMARLSTDSPEPIGEGVWRETVAAAGFSAWMLLAFGFVGWWWFPAGGVAISVLGILMSLLGLNSRLLKSSMISLALHSMVLVACYTQ